MKTHRWMALVLFAPSLVVAVELSIDPVTDRTYGRIDLRSAESTFPAAVEVCARIRGALATVTSQEENDFLTTLMEGVVDDSFWIGATDRVSEDNWRWLSGEPFVFESWNVNEPNDGGTGEDALTTFPNGLWNDLPYFGGGNKPRGALCEWPTPVTSFSACVSAANSHFIGAETVIEDADGAFSDEVTSSGCAVNTASTQGANVTLLLPAVNTFEGQFYDVVNERVNWTTAAGACRARGGHLATITSADENALVFSRLPQEEGVSGVWIGATDRPSEGNWRWVTGEPFSYTNWLSGEPNNTCPNGGGTEDFLTILADDPSGRWNDLPNDGCSEQKPYVCEFDNDPVPTDPAVISGCYAFGGLDLAGTEIAYAQPNGDVGVTVLDAEGCFDITVSKDKETDLSIQLPAVGP